MPVLIEHGFFFYLSFNLQLLLRLMFMKADAICAVDLDTILPVWFISKLKNCERIFDAHEWFCEMKELQHRPLVKKCWKRIERLTVPDFNHGYTVSPGIVSLMKEEYGHDYTLIRNMPLERNHEYVERKPPFILYQGAVNEGRCFETLIPAMALVDWPLHIYGTGNFMEQTQSLIRKHGLEEKVFLKGSLLPEDLRALTIRASIGISLFDDTALHNRVSLANRFFDFIHAGVPQICSDLPAYREINERYDIALLVEKPTIENIANGLNKLMCDELLYARLSSNCQRAARDLNWQHEQVILREFYSSLNL
jgi:glycosyltransferase involved in cell wall biosynthesis